MRRFQNSDGSLTPAGKKRYDNMSNDKLQKTLHKQVRKAREEQSDWVSSLDTSKTIGKYSKAAQDKYNKDYKKWENSESTKQVYKEMKKLGTKYETGKIDYDEYKSEFSRLNKSIYRPDLDRSVIYRFNEIDSYGVWRSKGKEYSKAYLNKYGKDLTIGYLRDLGYNESVAKELANRVLKSNNPMIN